MMLALRNLGRNLAAGFRLALFMQATRLAFRIDFVQLLLLFAVSAAIDVFAQEPPPAGHPFYALDDVVVSPHVSGFLPSYDDKCAELFAQNLRRYLAGEPLLNLDNVIPALRLMLDDNAYGLSRRRVTVSTSGVVPGMDRLRDECPVALAVSLHAPNDALRERLVPVNRKYPLAALLAACNRYLESAPRDFITFEYVMLEGVNDTEAHAREAAALAGSVRCKYNLIPFNPFNGVDYKRSSPERIRRFAEILQRAGLTVTTRKTRGEHIAAACGQLAGELTDRTRRGRRLQLKEVRA